jgi:diguanylate cyclase (GGDEF)-like protein
MKEWEQRALLREQEDPRRRASVMERLIEGLTAQIPTLLAAATLLFGVVAAWHLLFARGRPDAVALGSYTLVAALVCGVAAFWTRRGTIAPERAHISVFALTLVAAAVSFAHLALTGDLIHSFSFMVILMAAGAFFQDGRRLAVAGSVVVLAWVVGIQVVDPSPAGLAPAAMGMFSAVVLTTTISGYRIGALRRLESLNLELQDQIGFDPLTGIANRRAFYERLENVWERLAGEDEPLALIMIDLDEFKNLNDTRGHGEGDAALRQMGGVLRMGVRSTEDLPARLGGEEFAVLLPRTIEEHAIMIAERMRAAVMYTRIPNPGTGGDEILTASLGVALAWPRDGGDPSELMDRADRALYKAKHGGRNRVVVDDGRKPPDRAPYHDHFEKPVPGLEPRRDGVPGTP